MDGMRGDGMDETMAPLTNSKKAGTDLLALTIGQIFAHHQTNHAGNAR